MWWKLFAVSLLLVSCGAPVTLYTDEAFRNSAPEIAEAWQATAPWKPALVKDFAPGSGRANLEAELNRLPAPAVVLVGMALSDADRRSLQEAHPQTRLVFFSSAGNSDGLAVVGVRRKDAWLAVAKAAAGPGTAVVCYPADVTDDEMSTFEAVWKDSGGGVLTTAVGYQADKLAGTPTAVFHWAGPEWDGPIQSLNPSVKIHGNPGVARTLGASGLTWAVKKPGLGEFLWQAALDPEKKSHFLPLETVFERR